MGFRGRTVLFQDKSLGILSFGFSESDYGKRHDLRNFFYMNERYNMAV